MLFERVLCKRTAISNSKDFLFRRFGTLGINFGRWWFLLRNFSHQRALIRAPARWPPDFKSGGQQAGARELATAPFGL